MWQLSALKTWPKSLASVSENLCVLLRLRLCFVPQLSPIHHFYAILWLASDTVDFGTATMVSFLSKKSSEALAASMGSPRNF